jgi:hypothetical protein
MPTSLLTCRPDTHAHYLLNTIKPRGTFGYKSIRWLEVRGQRASDQHPATFASSGQRPEHQSPEPRALVKQTRYGMVQGYGMDWTRFVAGSHPEHARRLAHDGPHAAIASLGAEATMRARVITQYRDCGLVEYRRPHSQYHNSRAERKPVSLYVCRETGIDAQCRQLYKVVGNRSARSRLEFP